MRLSAASCERLGADVTQFTYDRTAQEVGIVHFGIGAFHRAHLAWYTDRAMDGGDRDWMLAGVSLRSVAVAEQLNPQDGLYTVNERSTASVAIRLVGAVREVLVATSAPADVVSRLKAPATRIVSFTVTEKGYCRAPDGSLDLALARQGSIYPLLGEACRQRRAAGIGGLTLLSCDNLAGNGAQLSCLMREYLAVEAPDLIAWFETECACPATMVDRIVPATTRADLDAVEGAIGLHDKAAIVTEPFSQWVIEDRFAGPRPRWEAVGAQLVVDVAPYETAKLRMLNGAHSALAYLGLQHGHAYVHQAIADPAIRPLIERLMREEAATSFDPAPGQDLTRYADALIARFSNPALQHRLIQIAMDGSQKIPQRWLETLSARQQRGLQCPSILAALAAWLRHLRGANIASWGPVDDPMADRLQQLARGRDTFDLCQNLFGRDGLFAPSWQGSQQDFAVICAAG